MKALITDFKTSFRAIISLAILLCGIYPIVVWGTSQLLFSDKAQGSLLEQEGKIVGSSLIGQGFHSPRYFQSRPSAAGKGYDATASSGSNLGPTSKKFIETVQSNIDAYRRMNAVDPNILIPGDAVTASASGLDPHISPRNAALQAPRVARERGLSKEEVLALVKVHTTMPFLGLIGEEAVNVVALNVALDRLKGH